MFAPVFLSLFESLLFRFLSLLGKSIAMCDLLGGVCGAFRGVVVETFLNLFWQLSEVHLGDSRLATQHNAVGFDTPHRDVFVFFSVNRFKDVGEDD